MYREVFICKHIYTRIHTYICAIYQEIDYRLLGLTLVVSLPNEAEIFPIDGELLEKVSL